MMMNFASRLGVKRSECDVNVGGEFAIMNDDVGRTRTDTRRATLSILPLPLLRHLLKPIWRWANPALPQ